MTLEFSSDEALLEDIRNGAVARAHAQGYRWFWRKWIPALERAARVSTISNELIAENYYIAGDVHDFIDAPKAAIAFYQKALAFNPELHAAHREIASMYWQMGQYDAALAHSDKALELDPSDEHARSDRDYYPGLEQDGPPLYLEGDVLWDAHEHLGAADPQSALAVVENIGGLPACRVKAQCYGALERCDDYLSGWREIASLSDVIELTYADWFFIPESVYDGAAFWQVLLSSKARFMGVCEEIEGLSDHGAYRALSIDERIRVKIKYFVAVRSRNIPVLRPMVADFPECAPFQQALAEMTA